MSVKNWYFLRLSLRIAYNFLPGQFANGYFQSISIAKLKRTEKNYNYSILFILHSAKLIFVILLLQLGFPFFRKKMSNPVLGTTRKNISEPRIPGSNPELGTIRKFFRVPTRNSTKFPVPTRNPEKLPGSNPERLGQEGG